MTTSYPPLDLLYRTYNSLFLSLPFQHIEQTGTLLALFAQQCDNGFKAGKSPVDIVQDFWDEYYENAPLDKRNDLLFYFIQYVERQVVLFDSVEDALFEQTHDMNGPGSLRYFTDKMTASEPLRQRLLNELSDYSVRLVLTAHPTQFYPGKVLGIINDLGMAIQANQLDQIQLLLMQLGKTTFFNRSRPRPIDEAIGLGWFMEHIFFHAIPDVVYRLLTELGQEVTVFNNARLMTLGFWPGGDRDGNPNVTSDTTLEVAQLLNRAVLRGYYREIREVRRRLTFRGVEEKIIEVDRRIYSTLFEPGPDSYHTCQELLADLQEARNVLIEEHSGLFLDILDRFILKIKVFGFYFASIDIRQDSRKHDEVWNPILTQLHERGSWPDLAEELNEPEQQRISRLLRLNFTLDENDYADPFLKETLRSIRAIFDIQKQNGEAGCHRYIISNCQCAYHVAEVLSLAQLVYSDYEENWKDNAQPPLDIVPLFETIDDLKSCDSVMETLYTNPEYLRHLQSRNMSQHIMLGFSDGTKDGGYLRANWSIYRAKEALTRISRQYGVTVTFFDGRGGPPGRGGGNNVMYYAAQGKDIENKGIQVTIQGQTVSSTYGTLPSAQFNVERLLVAGLENRMSSAATTTMSQEDMQAIDELADSAYKAYLELKNDPSFVPYLEKKTALRWYGDSNIASRPTKRNADAALKFEDLRAIPFVGAWAQMKQNVPGYHGVGSAIQAQGGAETEQIKGLYERSLFFRTLLDNSMQALKKSNFDATRYLSDDPEFGAFWKKLNNEFELTIRQLEILSGRKLLASNPLSLKSIELREQIVLPLIAIQQYALQQIENDNTTDEMAEVYRRMALRAMFGIINAARNAA